MQLSRVLALIACVIRAFSAVRCGREMSVSLMPAVKLNGIPRWIVSHASGRHHYGSKKAVQRPGQQGRGGATRSLKYDPTFISRIIYVGGLLKEEWYHIHIPFPRDTFEMMM